MELPMIYLKQNKIEGKWKSRFCNIFIRVGVLYLSGVRIGYLDYIKSLTKYCLQNNEVSCKSKREKSI